MPEMQKKSGVTTLVSEISCVVDHAKLSNLVIVAIVAFIYFWRKMKGFRPLEGRALMKIKFDLNVENHHFFVNFQGLEIVLFFWPVSRESVKELIYLKMGVTRHLRE